MVRAQNKSSKYYLLGTGRIGYSDLPNIYSKARLRAVYYPPENPAYRKGMPTIPKTVLVTK